MYNLYHRDGRCVVCEGTNICISCKGSGTKEDGFTCPTCFGDGDCKFCDNKKKQAVK